MVGVALSGGERLKEELPQQIAMSTSMAKSSAAAVHVLAQPMERVSSHTLEKQKLTQLQPPPRLPMNDKTVCVALEHVSYQTQPSTLMEQHHLQQVTHSHVLPANSEQHHPQQVAYSHMVPQNSMIESNLAPQPPSVIEHGSPQDSVWRRYFEGRTRGSASDTVPEDDQDIIRDLQSATSSCASASRDIWMAADAKAKPIVPPESFLINGTSATIFGTTILGAGHPLDKAPEPAAFYWNGEAPGSRLAAAAMAAAARDDCDSVVDECSLQRVMGRFGAPNAPRANEAASTTSSGQLPCESGLLMPASTMQTQWPASGIPLASEVIHGDEAFMQSFVLARSPSAAGSAQLCPTPPKNAVASQPWADPGVAIGAGLPKPVPADVNLGGSASMPPADMNPDQAAKFMTPTEGYAAVAPSVHQLGYAAARLPHAASIREVASDAGTWDEVASTVCNDDFPSTETYTSLGLLPAPVLRRPAAPEADDNIVWQGGSSRVSAAGTVETVSTVVSSELQVGLPSTLGGDAPCDGSPGDHGRTRPLQPRVRGLPGNTQHLTPTKSAGELKPKDGTPRIAVEEPLLAHAFSTVRLRDLAELRSFRHPPAVVCQVLEAVALLLGVTDTRWSLMRRLLDASLLGRMASFDPAQVTFMQSERLRVMLQVPTFTDGGLWERCPAAAPLAAWCTAVGTYLEQNQPQPPPPPPPQSLTSSSGRSASKGATSARSNVAQSQHNAVDYGGTWGVENMGSAVASTSLSPYPSVVATAVSSTSEPTAAHYPSTTPRATPAVATISRPRPDLGGMHVEPDLWSMTDAELARVSDLRVSRDCVGAVTFLGETDCRELVVELPNVVVLNPGEVIVYPDQDMKPPSGQGLNKPANVLLCGCLPKSVSLKDPKARERYRKRVKLMTEEKGAEFVDYDCDQGVWHFKVQHF